jgi:hypothetical protein
MYKGNLARAFTCVEAVLAIRQPRGVCRVAERLGCQNLRRYRFQSGNSGQTKKIEKFSGVRSNLRDLRCIKWRSSSMYLRRQRCGVRRCATSSRMRHGHSVSRHSLDGARYEPGRSRRHDQHYGNSSLELRYTGGILASTQSYSLCLICQRRT